MAPKLRLLQPGVPVTELERTDAELLSAFEQGDPARTRKLYDHLVGVVEGTLCRIIGGRGTEHEDLVQVVFEQLLITLRDKRFAGSCSLRGWAASISTNVALNALRSRGVQRRYFDRGDGAAQQLPRVRSDDDPESSVSLRREIVELRQMLSEMPVEQAQALLLHDAFGYELSEMALLAGASVAAVQSRLVRARRELKRRLESVRGNERDGGAS
jgi:RNA polymerase sigma factor (sigma-70 family)